MSPPERRGRLTAANGDPAQIVGAGRQNDTATIPPLPTAIPLFDVRVEVDAAYSKTTTYVPSVEMSSALASSGKFWQATARQAIRALAQTRESFTVDDLREDGLVPEPAVSNSWGAVLSAAANAGEIRLLGYRKSRRREAHSRVISVWSKP